MTISETIERLQRGDVMMTLGQVYGKAMEVQDAETATKFLTAIVANLMHRTPGETYEKIEAMALANIGYWTGYYSGEVARRVFRLFNCKHPVFGTSR